MTNSKQLFVQFLSRYDLFSRLLATYREWKLGRTPIDIGNEVPLVYVQNQEGVEQVQSAEHSLHGKALPDNLVIAGGLYRFSNSVYDCTAPGVYRFVDPQKSNRQHVVLDAEDRIASVLLVAFLCLRGNRDSKTTQLQLEKIALGRFLALTCGPACIFSSNLLNARGYQTRIVYSHTAGELNSYNNGHVLLEVYCSALRQYVAVDVDKKCLFRVEGKLASIFEYSEGLYLGKKVEINYFSPLAMIDYLAFTERATAFNYGFIEHATYSSSTELANNFARICQVPMMIDAGRSFVCAWDDGIGDRLRAINPDWQILDRRTFAEKFYPAQKAG